MGRKRKKKSSSKRKFDFKKIGRTLWFTAKVVVPATILCVGSWFSYQVVRADLVQDPFFRLKTVNVRTDGILTPGDVVSHLPVRLNMSLFEVSLPEVATALREMTSIKRFNIRKHFPSALEIDIYERKPLFQLKVKGSSAYHWIDSEGMAFKALSSESSGLLIVEDEKENAKTVAIGKQYPFYKFQRVASAIAIARENKVLEKEGLKKVIVDDSGDVRIVLKDNLELRIGRDRFNERLAKLVLVDDILSNEQERRKANYIDLRFDDIVVR